MQHEIQLALEQLEQSHSIRILYAVESGSRAWGFASADSDWDVRFIYVHHPDWYLSIADQKDSLEKMLPHDLDLSGWELRKALRLFRKSNPPMLEWLGSPIVYKDDSFLAKELRAINASYFAPQSCMYHYLHMAIGNVKAYLQSDKIYLKKYFYILRPILACDWICEIGNRVPMEFEVMVEQLISDPLLLRHIEELLALKRSGAEMREAARIPELDAFITSKIRFYEAYVQQQQNGEQVPIALLDELFRKTLYRAWNK